MARRGGKSDSPQSMSIMGHIQEIQRRLVFSALFFVAAASTAYAFKDQLLEVLLKPLDGQKLMYLNPAGGFSFILMVSIYAGVAFSAPFFIHQVYRFVRPALPRNVQRKSVQILIFSSLLLVAGVLFGYFYAIPGALLFLKDFAGDVVSASLTADSYLQFIAAYMLGLGLVFQLPLILMLIHWIKPLTPGGLMKSERWIVILSFVAAAIITPTPDPLNQTIIALPIILVYQLGVIAVLMNIRQTRRKNRRAEQSTSQAAPQPTSPQVLAPTSPRREQSFAIQPAQPPRVPAAGVATAPSMPSRSLDGMRARSRPVATPETQRSLPSPRGARTMDIKRTSSPQMPTPSRTLPRPTTVHNRTHRLTIDGMTPRYQLSR